MSSGQAIGYLAIGYLAIGYLAIGYLAIGYLSIHNKRMLSHIFPTISL